MIVFYHFDESVLPLISENDLPIIVLKSFHSLEKGIMKYIQYITLKRINGRWHFYVWLRNPKVNSVHCDLGLI